MAQKEGLAWTQVAKASPSQEQIQEATSKKDFDFCSASKIRSAGPPIAGRDSTPLHPPIPRRIKYLEQH